MVVTEVIIQDAVEMVQIIVPDAISLNIAGLMERVLTLVQNVKQNVLAT